MLSVGVPSSYRSERRYLLRVLFDEFLGIPVPVETEQRRDTEIRSGDGRTLVLKDGLFETVHERWPTAAALPAEPVPRWKWTGQLPGPPEALSVPVLYGYQLPAGGYFERRESGATLGLDVLGSSFFLLSRYEEAVVETRDAHDRFPAAASLAVRADYLGRPLVNEYLDILFAALKSVWPRLERSPRQSQVLLSHDVDEPLWLQGHSWMRVARAAGGDALKRRNCRGAAQRLWVRAANQLRLKRANPSNTFAWIMDRSEQHGLSSAFYFLEAESERDLDGAYTLDEPWIRRLIRQIAGRGHEIGIHPSYDSYLDPDRTKREFQRLKAVAEDEGVSQSRWGGRQHYLRWSNPHTWRNWEFAGLSYDSTLGFADRVGFRCGVCYEYPAFDLLTRRPLALRERPLIVMDVSLLRYMGLRGRDAVQVVSDFWESCRRHRGNFTLLWHNNNLRTAEEKQLYEEMLSVLG